MTNIMSNLAHKGELLDLLIKLENLVTSPGSLNSESREKMDLSSNKHGPNHWHINTNPHLHAVYSQTIHTVSAAKIYLDLPIWNHWT